MRSWKVLLQILVSLIVVGAPTAAYALVVEFYDSPTVDLVTGKLTSFGTLTRTVGSVSTGTSQTISPNFGSVSGHVLTCLLIQAISGDSAPTAKAIPGSSLNILRLRARIVNTCGSTKTALIRLRHDFPTTSFSPTTARRYTVALEGFFTPSGADAVTDNVEKRSWVTYPFLTLSGGGSPREPIGALRGATALPAVVKWPILTAATAEDFGPTTPQLASEQFTCGDVKASWAAGGACPTSTQQLHEILEDAVRIVLKNGDSVDLVNTDGVGGQPGRVRAYETSRLVHIDLQPLGDLEASVLSSGDQGTFLVALLGADEFVGGGDPENPTGFEEHSVFNPRPCAGLQVLEDCVLYETVVAGPGEAPVNLQHLKDVNKDGLADAVVKGKNVDLEYECGDTVFSLKGKAFFGTTLEDFEAVTRMEVGPC